MLMAIVIFLFSHLDVCRAAAKESLVREIPASDVQVKDLAEAVCRELFFDESETTQNKCRTQFLSHKHSNYPSSKIDIKLQTDYKVSFIITPSKYMQLIAMVSDDDANIPIEFTIIDPNIDKAVLYPQPGNYTFWTTILNEIGAPSLWKRGPLIRKVDHQNKHPTVNKLYDINIEFLKPYYENHEFLVTAKATWSPIDLADTFTVTNNCNKKTQGDIFYRHIEPYDDRLVVLQRLPLNDKCTFIIKGTYGITMKTYQTPPCNHEECVPDTAQNVTLNAEWDENEEMWLVQVNWSKPRQQPAHYNVTLRTNALRRSVKVSGNVTNVQFRRVKGDGFYNVSVVAHAGNHTSHTSVHDFFTPRQQASVSFGVLAGAWSAALVIVLALSVATFCWRRHLNLRNSNNYYRNTMLKIPQDDSEMGSPEGVEDQWEVRPERLLLHEVIGEGAFGVVRRGTFAPTNKDVAVKMLKAFPTVDEIRSFRAEMELMKSVGAHAHVVSLLACCSGRRPLIVVEYCSRGDLLSYLRCSWDLMLSRRNAKYYNNNKETINYRNDLFKTKPTNIKFAANRLYDLQGLCDTELTILDLLSLCRQIAMGMEFLASNRVIHRDLAARNILVTGDRTLKIADFGLSRDIYQENQYKQKGNGKMPVKWMALESLTHRIYTTQSDVWSFGVVVWEVVTVGGAPYAGVSAARLPRLLAAGYRMPRPSNCSAALYEMMLSCWSSRPRARPTFSQLHAKLDELLCACADHYLPLAVPADVPDAPETRPNPYRYVRMLIRGRRKRSKSYERPLAAPTNHYTDQPVVALT